MKLPIYLDYHATTPVDPRVLSRMLPYFSEHFGNAASRSHSFGWRAQKAVEVARQAVADLISASPQEIVFTSGATEANNLAIFGALEAYASRGNHIITQATEHRAVLDVCSALESRGCSITYLPVDAAGLVNVSDVAQAMTPRTVMVSIMHINNEIGTIQPLAEIGALCHKAGVLLHTDAAQSVGKVAFDVRAMQTDLASLSGHKLYGPKGIGALYVRRRGPRVSLRPQMFGGGHEAGMRPGTLNVAAIVGLGEACKLCAEELETESARVGALRDQLQAQLLALDGVMLNGHKVLRHPGNLNVSFAGLSAEALLLGFRNVAVSTGSACTSATLLPSHVLAALGMSEALSQSSIRFGLGRFTTLEEVEYVGQYITTQVTHLRGHGASNQRKVDD